MARSVRRSFGFATFGAPIVLVVALASCGGDDDASAGSLVEIKPSSYVTTPSTVSAPTTAPGAPAAQPGDTSPQEQSYEVQQGDGLYQIARKFGIEAEAIATYNQWADGIEHSIFAGDTIRIPPGAEVPSAEENTETTEEGSGDSGDQATETTEEGAELCPDGERQGHYTIQDTDTTRVGVANRLNVTVQQLDDANANTPGYSGFYPGLEILVPCGGDANASETTEA